MAQPTNSRLSGDIWHLSIDDLLAPVAQTARLGGPGPFVINLSASTAPISLPVKAIAGSELAHVYQLQRIEDGRMRYRLRLGPFDSEDLAEEVLSKVRDVYPGAATATAASDDLRAIELLLAKIDAQQSRSKRPAAGPTAVRSNPATAPQAAPKDLPRAAANSPISHTFNSSNSSTPAAASPATSKAVPAPLPAASFAPATKPAAVTTPAPAATIAPPAKVLSAAAPAPAASVAPAARAAPVAAATTTVNASSSAKPAAPAMVAAPTPAVASS